MKSFTERLAEVYVCEDSKITPWGTIKIRDKENKGRTFFRCWSQKLVRYGNDSFHIEFKVTSTHVFNQQGQEVEIVSSNELFLVCELEYFWEVLPDGHLWLPEPYDKEIRRDYLESFQAAEKGEQPWRIDERPFTKVPQEFTGQELMVLYLNRGGTEVKVYTKEGREVSCKVHFPLSTRMKKGDKPKILFTNEKLRTQAEYILKAAGIEAEYTKTKPDYDQEALVLIVPDRGGQLYGVSGIEEYVRWGRKK